MIESGKLMNLADGQVLYNDLRGRVGAESDKKADVITSTASGAIATFVDGADDMPMALTVGIEPVQDLHGQDAPYPAGGGKNKLDTSSFTTTSYGGITYTKQTDGGIKVSGTVTDVASIYVVQSMSLTLPAGTYTLSGTGVSDIYAYLLPGYRGGTFTIDEETTFTALQMRQNTVGYTANFTYYPQLESGSTATDYAPYSNICPISGWTEADVTRVGENWFNFPTYEQYINASVGLNNYKNFPIRVKPKTNYYLFTTYASGFTPISTFWLVAADKLNTGWRSIIHSSGGIINGTIKSDDDGYIWLNMYNYNHNEDTYNNTVANIYTQLIEGTTAPADFTPYQGETYSITFPQSAGTVYGGTLSINTDGTGSLVVDRGMWTKNTSTMDNSDSAPGWRGAGIKALIGSGINTGFNAMMNIGSRYNANTIGSNDILFLDPVIYGKTQSEWQALAVDVQIVVELATPVIYTLTAPQVRTILGMNNVWSDTGDTTADYPADTKLYIDGKIAELQALILENINNA